MLKFRCPDCRQKIGVPEAYAGRWVRCPRCASAIEAPLTDSSNEKALLAETPIQATAAVEADLFEGAAPPEAFIEPAAVIVRSLPSGQGTGKLSGRSGSPSGAPGAFAVAAGLAALSLCFLPARAKFAVPLGIGGLILALIGAVMSARRNTSIAAPAIGALLSTAAVVLALLVGVGIVPMERRHAAAALPTVRAGDIEVRIASAEVLRAVVCAGEHQAFRSMARPALRVTLELRNLGTAPVSYVTWGKAAPQADAAIARDASGTAFTLADVSPVVPLGRVREIPTILAPSHKGVQDVLLFERPVDLTQDIELELPGANIGAPGTKLDVRIVPRVAP